MERRAKFSAEEKVVAVNRYLKRGESQRSIAESLGIAVPSLQVWVRNYQSMGSNAFEEKGHKGYSSELKAEAVNEYLEGGISQKELCKKYQMKSPSQLKQWIVKYNGHEELKTTRKGGSYMTRGRKTSFAEQVEIVSWHLENGAGYEKTSEHFKVSYQQVYSWVRKYQEQGIEGLRDRHGRKKPEEEMSEVEQLRAENRMLKAENRYREWRICS